MKENIKEIFGVIKEWWKKILLVAKKYLLLLKKNWVFFTLVLVLFSSATVCLHLGTAKTFSGREEFFHERLAEAARKNEEQTILMNIKPNKCDNAYLKQITEAYININNQNVDIENKYLNSVKYVIDSQNFKCDDTSNATIIFPQFFSSKEVILDGEIRYRMDLMNLYYYEKPSYNANGADSWCVISSNFAQKIMGEKNKSEINEIIGEVITVNIRRNNESIDFKLSVNAIYDSNLGDAQKLEKRYGDVILSWFFHSATSYQYNDVSISLELHHDTVANKNTIYYFYEYYNLDNSEIKFMSGEEFQEDEAIFNSYLKLYFGSNSDYIEISIATFIYFLLVFYIVYYVILDKKGKQDKTNKYLGLLVFIHLIALGLIEIVLSNINYTLLMNYEYNIGIYTSKASIYSLLIIPIIFLMFIAKGFLEGGKEGDAGVK